MNPGSPEAIKAGCKCPVMDNANGKGIPWGADGPIFWIDPDCKLHANPNDYMEDDDGEISVEM